jgi:hypothetical protein
MEIPLNMHLPQMEVQPHKPGVLTNQNGYTQGGVDDHIPGVLPETTEVSQELSLRPL